MYVTDFTDSATTAATTSVDGMEASATDQSFSIDSECSNFNCHESIFSYFDLSQFVCILIGLFAIAFTSIFLLFFCLVERNRCRTITFASQWLMTIVLVFTSIHSNDTWNPPWNLNVFDLYIEKERTEKNECKTLGWNLAEKLSFIFFFSCWLVEQRRTNWFQQL